MALLSPKMATKYRISDCDVVWNVSDARRGSRRDSPTSDPQHEREKSSSTICPSWGDCSNCTSEEEEEVEDVSSFILNGGGVHLKRPLTTRRQKCNALSS